ncbi:MAG: 1-acyl-sn-glycerol-3-phosphate acyltransferase [Anaeromyxobacteraceae bacterium]
MTDAPGSPPQARAAGAPPPAAPRAFLDRWFAPIRVTRDAPDELRALAARGSLVYVMRAPGLLNFLYLRWFLHRNGLPPLRAAQGFPGFRGWIARVWRSRRAFSETVSRGEGAVVFLGGRGPRDPFPLLVELQRARPAPIFLVPVLLVWSLRAQKLRPTAADILYGSAEAPTPFATALSFLRSFRQAFFNVGRALDLSVAVVQEGAEPDAVIARKARGALHQHLARQFRTAVGPRLKTPSRVREKVLRDRTLRAAIEAVAAESGRAPAAVEAEARKDLAEISARYDPRLVQVARAFLAWVFGRLYTSVEVDEAGLARLKKLAAERPIVLCPSHKSHIDYLVLSWLLFDNGMTPPHIAAGINLAFWPFDGIARKGGAFFIRRTVKGDKIYTAVLRAYVKHLLKERFPQEFYVEGGRSRTGKLLFPKTGLISMEVDAWLDGAADDVVFVPVSIDYERLIEASSYVRELSGAEKQKESFGALLGSAKVLLRRYQRLYVQFEEPISLRQVAEERLGERASALTLDEAWSGGEATAALAPPLAPGMRGAPAEAKRQLVQALGNRIAYGISRAVTVTPIGLVAATLLSHARRGLGAPEVARRVELLRYIAAEGGARFARDLAGAPSDPREEGPIADAVGVLAAGGLVTVEVAAGETIYIVPDDKRLVLDYHRNAVIHRFVAPALVSAAIVAGGGSTTLDAAHERALFLSRLFKLEFMYRPGATFDEIFDWNLSFLERIGAVAREAYRLAPGKEQGHLAFLAEFIRAYLEAYRLTGEAVQALLGAEGAAPVERRALVGQVQERGRADFLSGRVALREALSRATLENAIAWLTTQGVLAAKDGKVALAEGGAARLAGILDGVRPHFPA